MDRPLWQPAPERIRAANLTAFIRHVNDRYRLNLQAYPDLYRWSVDSPEKFWPCVWDFCGIMEDRKWDRVVVDADKMPGAKWFPGARLNFARNLLRHGDARPAVIFRGESGQRRVLSHSELNRQVAILAESLRGLGLEAGDRVGAILPNMPEAISAMLATASLGGIWSSCSPDFGVKGIMDRFGQIAPKVLFAADGYYYNGRRIDSLDRIEQIVDRLPSVEKTIIVPHLNGRPRIENIRSAVARPDCASLSSPSCPDFASLPFDHPLYIMYSSGTTGLPKSIVHGAGGTLIQHLKELVLHTDLKADDCIFYFTTCGWMMWNWLVSGLAVGATLLLYDGSPTYPDTGELFRISSEEGVTVFGTSAKFISAVEKAGLQPGRSYDLSKLRTLLSTGSPLSPESFDYVYRSIKGDLCLSSISGGTDIISCFALGNPTGPVWRGELQARGLGMNVKVFDPQGRELVGEKGELVCTAPFPSMPVSFWGDPDGARYRAAYFERFRNVWHHGDYAELTRHGGLIIHGRSDAVLNPGGVRIGTAEIYRVVESMDEVIESICVGQEWNNDVRVVLFVRLAAGLELDDALRMKIREHIRLNATPRHVPAKVIQVADIPRTISGKITELAVRNIIHGMKVENRAALANPEALELYRDLRELKE